MMGLPYVLGAFLSYATASAFFWQFPHFLHKKKTISFKSAHISHRGGSAEGYENTLKNFKGAVQNGTDMLELDVRLTKDRKVVVFHDQSLSRLTGHKLNIADVNYDSLPRINAEIPIDTIPGVYFTDDTWPADDRKIPLLRDVFHTFPNIPINIDIKENNILLIHEVSKLITEFQRTSITVWGSFANEVCDKLYSVNQDVCLFFSAKRVALLIMCALTGLLPFMPIKETHYEVFLPLALRRRRLREVVELTFFEKCVFWGCETFLTWQPLINHLKKRGIHVYFWVCNDVEEFELCKKLGATGIMTDYPTLLRDFLLKNDAQA